MTTTELHRVPLPGYDPTRPAVDLLPERAGGKSGGLTWWAIDDDASPQAGYVRLAVGGDATTYTVTESPAGMPGRIFTLSKLVSKSGKDQSAELYHVFCSERGEAGDTCTCKGWHYTHHCKHADACRTLIANGWL